MGPCLGRIRCRCAESVCRGRFIAHFHALGLISAASFGATDTLQRVLCDRGWLFEQGLI